MALHCKVVPRESLFQLKEVGSEYFVETSGDRRTTPLSNFSFRVLTTRLIVEVTGEVRPCDESSSTRCTILISVLASLCLLLFAGLALSLIVLKERRRIYEKGINSSKNSKNHYKSSPSIEDSPPPPVPPVNKPRKSSLKPPRTEAYPAPGAITLQPEGLQESPSETGGSTSPGIANPVLNGGRRKSIVTFNERTEIRT
ncbi:hypothetical protein TYRP_007605 [Tyrophagus putrescentiae]|nr:hypothetical protein TYRP_007605 [Tyrophagus putrescentiae]